MGKSSAYPRAFGDAIRFAHTLSKTYGGVLTDDARQAIATFTDDLVRSLPPPGEMFLPDLGWPNPCFNQFGFQPRVLANIRSIKYHDCLCGNTNE